MAKVVVMYKQPADPAAFDAYYADVHIPLAKKIVGLERFEVSKGPIATPGGASPYYFVATLAFASMSVLQQAMGSPEGRAAGADMANFATGGADLLMFESEEV
jgi:uncharacterized protein (TIGR02118 family)